ncbi:vomeronasal type-2 receptor 26-like isoform X2 [Mixophyes fleayi]|uniref:vomeronasal type-2 receptor 26-like isoform X2 n=1 Tax=Mixophyes fleayi TaxID=3061075 RepID=UPI003F4DEDEE
MTVMDMVKWWLLLDICCLLHLRPLQVCSESMGTPRSVPVSEYDVDNFRVTYSVYTAVYAVAHALHYMFTSRSQDKIISATPGQLTRYVKRVHFRTTSGDEIFFDEKGDPPERIDLLNWLIFPNDTVKRTQVGQYHSQQLFLNKSTVIWGNLSDMTPRSVCSEDCIPGYRKSLVKGKPVCCFVCAPCSEGEITNTTDTETCIICPEEEWPNEKKDRCVKRVTLFLNIQDPLGTLLLASTGVFFIMTTVVLAIFIKHRDTPIVRANNIHVSFILIISLMFSFLCVLLFIGRPTVLSCLLRQVVFCLIFTLAISSTLAKTIIVLVAFTSTKPGGISKNWMGSSLSRLIIFICCLGQVLICSVWLLQSPPFPDKDTRSEVGKIILQCNEGSTTAFYAALGYMGFLAVSSFILAFLVRKLPDCFNEAHYITFSMLVFCSVWVTFIPVYLRTKGKYTVAVEVFAILASSAGLLFCLFIPKCFTIIIRPERNSRESVSDRKLH